MNDDLWTGVLVVIVLVYLVVALLNPEKF